MRNVENNVESEEIAHDEQFLHLSQCFQKFQGFVSSEIRRREGKGV